MILRTSIFALVTCLLVVSESAPIVDSQQSAFDDNNLIAEPNQQISLHKRSLYNLIGTTVASEAARKAARAGALKYVPTIIKKLSTRVKIPNAATNFAEKSLSRSALEPLVMAGRSPLQKAQGHVTAAGIAAVSSTVTGAGMFTARKKLKEREASQQDDDEDGEEEEVQEEEQEEGDQEAEQEEEQEEEEEEEPNQDDEEPEEQEKKTTKKEKKSKRKAKDEEEEESTELEEEEPEEEKTPKRGRWWSWRKKETKKSEEPEYKDE